MYKLLLCLRYLRTRYIAMASIISVMLGVATMIVVNGVMSGFSHEMKTRLHGILGDISVEAWNANGFPDAEDKMQRIKAVLGDDVAAMTPLCATAGVMNYRITLYEPEADTRYICSPSQWLASEVVIIGVDENTKGGVGDFNKFLQHPGNRDQLSFTLRDGGYDEYDHQVVLSDTGVLGKIITWCAKIAGRDTQKDPLFSKEVKRRAEMKDAGWKSRRQCYDRMKMIDFEYTVPPARDYRHAEGEADATDNLAGLEIQPPPEDTPMPEAGGEMPANIPEDATADDANVVDPFAQEAKIFDPTKEQHPGAVLGMGLSIARDKGREFFRILPGDDFKLTFPSNGMPPVGVTANFTCVDLYESKMSEYDGRFVFLPLTELQRLRGMADPSDPRMSRVNQIQMKLRPGVDLDAARDKLRLVFDPMLYEVRTWRDHQMVLLQAVETETRMLNVLLFMIIAVSGFGILAIFYTIVVEKTKDIGILKALGASSSGIMGIFLMYGLALGIVGAGMGCIVGLLFVWNINEIADLLSWLLGYPVFNPDIYFFYEIPYDVDPWTVTWIVTGALVIAVLASVFPAWRASRLQPVDSLRYE